MMDIYLWLLGFADLCCLMNIEVDCQSDCLELGAAFLQKRAIDCKRCDIVNAVDGGLPFDSTKLLM